MAKETKKFAEAFAVKDEVEGFLANLEKLKADGTITEEQHATLKEEYDTRLNAATSEIARIKSAFKKQLETTQRDTETYKWELGKIEVKFKVGELPLDKYQSSDRKLRAKIEELEAAAGELERLIKANCSADIAAPAKKPGVDIRELPTISKVATRAKAAAPPKEIKPPKAKAPELPSLIRAAPSAEGLLTPRSKLLAMAGGVLLVISIFLPWVAGSETLGPGFGTDSGISISIILGAAGIVCGLAVVGTAFLLGQRARGTVQIMMGVAALAALAAIVLLGILPLLSEYARTLMVIREGLYLYVIAAVILIVAGPLERKQR